MKHLSEHSNIFLLFSTALCCFVNGAVCRHGVECAFQLHCCTYVYGLQEDGYCDKRESAWWQTEDLGSKQRHLNEQCCVLWWLYDLWTPPFSWCMPKFHSLKERLYEHRYLVSIWSSLTDIRTSSLASTPSKFSLRFLRFLVEKLHSNIWYPLSHSLSSFEEPSENLNKGIIGSRLEAIIQACLFVSHQKAAEWWVDWLLWLVWLVRSVWQDRVNTPSFKERQSGQAKRC